MHLIFTTILCHGLTSFSLRLSFHKMHPEILDTAFMFIVFSPHLLHFPFYNEAHIA
jgi:hypothetical protein